MQRRNALKLMLGGGAAAAGLGATQLQAGDKSINARIAIMGGGLGGITLAAKLRRDMPNATISIFDANEELYYQPGFTLIAAGFYGMDDVLYDKSEYIPKGVNWVKKMVSRIEPAQNTLILSDGSQEKYDYLVIATGVEYDYSAISGLEKDDIISDSTAISTIYVAKSAIKTNKLREEFVKTGGRAIFCEPKGSMKCAGANKKVMFLTEDSMRRAKVRDKGEFALFGGNKTMFSNPVYAQRIGMEMADRGIDFSGGVNHEIIGIDKRTGKATFRKYMTITQNGEPSVITDEIETNFDFLHFTPKQIGLDLFVEAGLTNGNPEKWVDVNKETLQSTQYKNIFAIGDVCGLPMGKTGASIRKMYPVLAANLAAQIKGNPLEAKFDGYTACPLIIKYGQVIMVEFNWAGTAPSIPCFGATRASYAGWLTKLYAFKPMVMTAMLRALA